MQPNEHLFIVIAVTPSPIPPFSTNITRLCLRQTTVTATLTAPSIPIALRLASQILRSFFSLSTSTLPQFEPVAASRVTFAYHSIEALDWNNEQDVENLNGWRQGTLDLLADESEPLAGE